ncbi:MAG: DUF169 domain-containing protein [Terriglobia bacterium]
MNFTQVAKMLKHSLGLATPPIGLAFLEEPPAGVPRYAQAVPTACTFWKAAQTSLFYATAEDHYNCPIGAITQGFKPPAEVMEQAMQLIGQMGKIQYFDAAEVGNIPSVEKPHSVVVYGPLEAFSEVAPDLAMIICKPFQAMLISEATGASAWQGAGKESHIFGRPACAVIPSALKESATAASLGCMGARTFAGIEDGEMIVAIPLDGITALSEESLKILNANAEMQNFYKDRKAQFAAV